MNTNAVIEILTLTLKSGVRDKFDRLYQDESLPLQKKWKIDVVSFGPSLHNEDTYYVIRSFENLEDRQKKQDDFYGSDEWKQGPRTAILSMIENLSTLVISRETFNNWTSFFSKQ